MFGEHLLRRLVAVRAELLVPPILEVLVLLVQPGDRHVRLDQLLSVLAALRLQIAEPLHLPFTTTFGGLTIASSLLLVRIIGDRIIVAVRYLSLLGLVGRFI